RGALCLLTEPFAIAPGPVSVGALLVRRRTLEATPTTAHVGEDHFLVWLICEERSYTGHQRRVRNMRQDSRPLVHQPRRDAIALDNNSASAFYHEMMGDDYAERRSYRLGDADESCDKILFWLEPHIWRCEEVVQRGLLLRRRDLLDR